MMFWRRLTVLIPAVVLIASLVGIFATRGAVTNLPFLKWRQLHGPNDDLVDQRPWQTAQALAGMAVSEQEHDYAQEALRLSDHEVDQAFAQALREAPLQQKPLDAEGQALQKRTAALQQTVKEDQDLVDQLTAALKSQQRPRRGEKPVTPDDLNSAKEQLQLDGDQLDDANEDLARKSGDMRSQIQQELNAREAATKKFESENGDKPQTTLMSVKRYGTLSGRLGAWLNQQNRMDMLGQAQEQAQKDIAELTTQHNDLENKLNGLKKNLKSTTSDRTALLERMHSLVKIQGILDDRIQTQQQLVTIYGRWLNQVKVQRAALRNILMRSIALIAFLFLCGSLANAALRKVLNKLGLDSRSRHALQTVLSLGVHLVTIALVLLAVFGAPNQTPTMLGLMTAGLTVALQSFIISFLGWFVLMGKNGLRVGDWVEINGVGGEVTEIGMFRTKVLETGNWTDKGHPTGRSVSFMNSFAISGYFFNFSTSGQWMWDEIRVNVPAGGDTYQKIALIQEAVQKETKENAEQAEREWKATMSQAGLREFSAAPSLSQRPAASGTDVVVRYVTRAGDRYEMKNRLFQAVMDVLQEPAEMAVGRRG
jgi:small-conductance mechanosensitive channel